MLIEIGFVGINLVIGLLLDILDLAAESMVNRFELKLTVADPGWPVGATIGWGTPIVPFVVFGAIILNVILLLLKLTKTVNIDIFNYWHFMLTGGVVHTVTNSITISVIASLLPFYIATD
ncbi:PTS transporter subunit IIC [Aneurinibacillus thermoaerophilus]|uniref:PTS transporter subunit IIC n=1 Tax=Aneurinibacillus thermoaerophilus TaxID=143495 RepID=UPI002E1E249D|nr:PTS transporter subunit IIC [Aneurinibacillus thermoaerophilus]MED0736609.1 PTS transporter subunit IIC [Aneurinibacillus thermoaerophilus]